MHLVNREGGVVGFDDGVGDLGAGHHRVGVHDTVGELLPDLGDEEGAHAGAGAAAEAVGELEALQAVAALRLLPHNVQHAVHQLGA